METYKYVIIGGGLAGHRGADGIRSMDPNGSIALVTAEPHLPYQRPPLSKGYLRGEEELDEVYLDKKAYYVENEITLIRGLSVTSIDPETRTLKLEDGELLGYEKLLLATGGHAWRLPVSGNNLPGVFTLRTIEDSSAIRQFARDSSRAVVVGGSFIGSEVAASLVELNLDVTMVFLESRLLERIVPEELSVWLHDKYESKGVRIIPDATLDALQGEGRIQRAVIKSNKSYIIETDLVVMGVGIRLNTELAQTAGLEMTDDDGIVVDKHLRTSDPNIYAAGDIAAWPDPTFERRLRVEHWDVARRQGRRAGKNMAGEEKPYTALPYFFSDLFDLSFEVWGNLNKWDQAVRRGSLEEESFAYYYFDEGELTGVLASGRPSEERKTMQALVKARPSYEEVGDRLSDPTLELASLIE